MSLSALVGRHYQPDSGYSESQSGLGTHSLQRDEGNVLSDTSMPDGFH